MESNDEKARDAQPPMPSSHTPSSSSAAPASPAAYSISGISTTVPLSLAAASLTNECTAPPTSEDTTRSPFNAGNAGCQGEAGDASFSSVTPTSADAARADIAHNARTLCAPTALQAPIPGVLGTHASLHRSGSDQVYVCNADAPEPTPVATSSLSPEMACAGHDPITPASPVAAAAPTGPVALKAPVYPPLVPVAPIELVTTDARDTSASLFGAHEHALSLAIAIDQASSSPVSSLIATSASSPLSVAVTQPSFLRELLPSQPSPSLAVGSSAQLLEETAMTVASSLLDAVFSSSLPAALERLALTNSWPPPPASSPSFAVGRSAHLLEETAKTVVSSLLDAVFASSVPAALERLAFTNSWPPPPASSPNFAVGRSAHLLEETAMTVVSSLLDAVFASSVPAALQLSSNINARPPRAPPLQLSSSKSFGSDLAVGSSAQLLEETALTVASSVLDAVFASSLPMALEPSSHTRVQSSPSPACERQSCEQEPATPLLVGSSPTHHAVGYRVDVGNEVIAGADGVLAGGSLQAQDPPCTAGRGIHVDALAAVSSSSSAHPGIGEAPRISSLPAAADATREQLTSSSLAPAAATTCTAQACEQGAEGFQDSKGSQSPDDHTTASSTAASSFTAKVSPQRASPSASSSPAPLATMSSSSESLLTTATDASNVSLSSSLVASCASASVDKWPISDRGVSAQFLREFRDYCVRQEGVDGDWTTTKVSKTIVERKTNGIKDAFIALDEYKDNPALIEKATVFVSHAWGNSFLEAVDILLCYEEENPGSFFWFDLFVNNQHDTAVKDVEWWCTTFSRNIECMGRVLTIMAPWHKPVPLSRSWCLYEIFTAIRVQARVRVAFPQRELSNLEATLRCSQTESDGAMALSDAFADVSNTNNPGSICTGKSTTATSSSSTITASTTNTTSTTNDISTAATNDTKDTTNTASAASTTSSSSRGSVRREHSVFAVRSSERNPIFEAMSHVDLEKSRAGKESDREKIIEVIKNSSTFSHVNKTVKDWLRAEFVCNVKAMFSLHAILSPDRLQQEEAEDSHDQCSFMSPPPTASECDSAYAVSQSQVCPGSMAASTLPHLPSANANTIHASLAEGEQATASARSTESLLQMQSSTPCAAAQETYKASHALHHGAGAASACESSSICASPPFSSTSCSKAQCDPSPTSSAVAAPRPSERSSSGSASSDLSVHDATRDLQELGDDCLASILELFLAFGYAKEASVLCEAAGVMTASSSRAGRIDAGELPHQWLSMPCEASNASRSQKTGSSGDSAGSLMADTCVADGGRSVSLVCAKSEGPMMESERTRESQPCVKPSHTRSACISSATDPQSLSAVEITCTCSYSVQALPIPPRASCLPSLPSVSLPSASWWRCRQLYLVTLVDCGRFEEAVAFGETLVDEMEQCLYLNRCRYILHRETMSPSQAQQLCGKQGSSRTELAQDKSTSATEREAMEPSPSPTVTSDSAPANTEDDGGLCSNLPPIVPTDLCNPCLASARNASADRSRGENFQPEESSDALWKEMVDSQVREELGLPWAEVLQLCFALRGLAEALERSSRPKALNDEELALQTSLRLLDELERVLTECGCPFPDSALRRSAWAGPSSLPVTPPIGSCFFACELCGADYFVSDAHLRTCSSSCTLVAMCGSMVCQHRMKGNSLCSVHPLLLVAPYSAKLLHRVVCVPCEHHTFCEHPTSSCALSELTPCGEPKQNAAPTIPPLKEVLEELLSEPCSAPSLTLSTTDPTGTQLPGPADSRKTSSPEVARTSHSRRRWPKQYWNELVSHRAILLRSQGRLCVKKEEFPHDFFRALQLYLHSLALEKAINPGNWQRDVNTITIIADIARLYLHPNLKDSAEVVVWLYSTKILPMQMEIFGSDDRHVAISLTDRAMALQRTGKMNDAMDDLQRAHSLLQALKKQGCGSFEDEAKILFRWCALLAHSQQLAMAIEKGRACLDLFRKIFSPPHPWIAKALNRLGQIYNAAGDKLNGEKYMQEYEEMHDSLKVANVS